MSNINCPIVQKDSFFSLFLWMVGLVLVGSLIGSVTTLEIGAWYSTLNRSPLTPASWVFPIVWTILYMIVAAAGWTIWRAASFPQLRLIKVLFVIQLILNWSWTPLFFGHHLVGAALVGLMLMDITVLLMIAKSYAKIRAASLLMLPYLVWIVFATYLNFYIWQHL